MLLNKMKEIYIIIYIYLLCITSQILLCIQFCTKATFNVIHERGKLYFLMNLELWMGMHKLYYFTKSLPH